MSGLFFVILASFSWAIDTLIRYPLLGSGVSAEMIVLTEHLILSAIFLPFVIKNFKHYTKMSVSDLFSFIVIGGLGSALATLFFTKAFTFLNPSLVIVLQKLQPIFAISLAAFILGERIHGRFVIFGIICLVGAWLVSYQDLMPGLKELSFSFGSFSEKTKWGYIYTMLAVLSWASATVFGKKLASNGHGEKEIMAGRFFMGLIFLLPFINQLKTPTDSDNLVIYGKIAAMVLISGLLGMWLYYKGLKRLSAKLCALAELFFPFCAVTVNWLFLDASLDTVQLIGAGLLLFGSLVIQWKKY